MVKAQTADRAITMEALLTLAPPKALERDELERATIEVEALLAEDLSGIGGGASASASFADGHVEIDLTLDGCTLMQLHEQVALLVTQLEALSELRFASLATRTATTAAAPLPA